MRRSHAVLSEDEPDRDRATVAGQLGRFLAIAGDHQVAMPFIEEALELAEQLELPDVFSNALSSRAIALQRMGRLNESNVLLETALEVALANDLGQAASRAYNNLSVAKESLDQFQGFVETSEAALALARRIGSGPASPCHGWTPKSASVSIAMNDGNRSAKVQPSFPAAAQAS